MGMAICRPSDCDHMREGARCRGCGLFHSRRIGEARRLVARKKEESKPGEEDARGLLMYRREMPDVFVALN